MKCLEELEQKVLNLIEVSKNLKREVHKLKEENQILMSKAEHFESSLMRENNKGQNWVDEKNKIKNSIETLLTNISNLESSEKVE